MIARVYRLMADAARLDEACVELSALAQLVAGCEGCLGAEAFQDVADQDQLVFVERWASQPAYEAAKKRLLPDAFSRLGRMLVGAPQVAVLEGLPRAAEA